MSDDASQADAPGQPGGQSAGAADRRPRRLRVAWVAGRDSLGRLLAVLRPLAVGLLDELVEITLLCPAHQDDAPADAPLAEAIPYDPPVWPMVGRVARAILAERGMRGLDLLHALDASASRLTRELARQGGLPYVVSSASASDARRVGRMNARLAAVLAASEGVEMAMVKHHVAPASKIHLVRPGLHAAKRSRCFRDPSHAVSIVAACRLRSRPVLRATAEAFAELRREGHDCLFMVIGSGRGESFLRREVARLGLRREVTFADEQFSSQLGKIIMAADVFVSPDPPEGIDLGSLMAMASGVPVVAGRGEDGFVVPGRTAILCDPTSARQLAAAIMGLLDDHASARALAESALEYCRDEHSPSAMVGQVARIYRQAASGHAG